MTTSELKTFRYLLGISESSGRYDNDSTYKGLTYWGKYQFSQARIQDICKYLNISFPIDRKDFTPEMQEIFFDAHTNMHEKSIYNNGLDAFIGKEITGKGNLKTTTIELEGLLAGAHIGGFTGLKNYLLSGKDASDGNNYISDYIVKFSLKKKRKPALKKY